MLSLFGPPTRRGLTHCDGVSRRSFVRAGALGLVGLSLPEILAAEDRQSAGSSQKAIIHVHLDGGPPQMDMIDPKPNAPSEYRGDITPLRSNVPGIHLTELMPKVAGMADQFAFLRSVVGFEGKHNAFQVQSGFGEKDMGNVGGRPAMGCVASHLLGTPRDEVPVFVDLMQGRPLVRNSARPGFLGPAFKPFRPDISHLFPRELEDKMKGELARLGKNHSTKLSLVDGIDLGRLDDRLSLLRNFDTARREMDAAGDMAAMDVFTRQAYNILTSGKIAAALDLEHEDPKTLALYTPQLREQALAQFTSEGPIAARKLLIARRLVEAGCRVVSVSISDFDTHANNFPRMRQLGPIADHALWALVTDLRQRRMLDDVTVLAWGEFGRSPKVVKNGGRDHWPKVGMAIMAGGGMHTGQVIGATDRLAGSATERPVHVREVLATLYHNLGLDPATTTIEDPTGRPVHVIDRQPIRELVG